MKAFFAKMKQKLNFRDEENILHITKYSKIWFIIPAVIIFFTLVLGTIYQVVPNIDKFMNIGIDFQGGSLLTAEMDNADMNNANYDTNLGIIKDVLKANGLKVSVAQKSGDNAIIVRYTNVVNGVSYAGDDKADAMTKLNNQIKVQIQDKLQQAYPNAKVPEPSVSMIGASASNRLLSTAFLSVGIAILLILIYIIFRFDFFSGVSAIIGLLHDVLIMFAFTIIFRVQVNSSFVAAIITIVAYSINNTIIVFDRVRHAVKENKKAGIVVAPKALADEAVTRTMTRSLFTTLTTLITVLCLVIFGVATIKEFALPILFGLFAGFFSSVFIAPSLWAIMKDAWDKKKLAKAKPQNPNSTNNDTKPKDGGNKPKKPKTVKTFKTPQSKQAKARKKNAISYQ